MIHEQGVVAVIPARGGSKSVPGKNLRDLGGMPLIAWSITTAQRCPLVDRVIVSTDAVEIAEVAKCFGAEVYDRPAHLATDDALVIDALRDLIRRLNMEGEKAEIMVLLEPTCPFRAVDDVSTCILRLVEEKLDSIATFKAAELNPHRAWRIESGRPGTFIEGSVPWMPRQQLPSAYQLSGDVYAFRHAELRAEERGLLFGRSGAVKVEGHGSIDIDDERDFLLAELISKEIGHASVPA
ncbi:acylneuraminate cytidylyltransferase family protein [Halomonas sp. LR5S13]|uniref:acylneuraminate cytidylyltransferase family protein n=1 Tax=Halomonas rhizosphaerae TaxID=3043296 RepID=UPI0024A7DB0B|nr:acylneuraminate cytidylyltransferase family protein [Halomonas rhizosphaerae]MDI5920866.1 acylneuraminate cytidylyltransferase family protein [Halomonas rhizosphaerae]